jgi:hypothetical protein
MAGQVKLIANKLPKVPNKALRMGGKKGARTPERNSKGDVNTRSMAAATWTPRNLRCHRGD